MPLQLLPWPLVEQGESIHPVATLQHLLRSHHLILAVDGRFGPATRRAVVAFQRQSGLTQDGVVGPKTWPALVIQLKKGDRGDAVRGLQEEFLYRDGQDPPSTTIDGIFGKDTDRMVRGFQEALGLKADGLVGPLTWRALVSGMLNI